MGRGNGGDPIFKTVDDRLIFLGILEEVTRRCRVFVLAYCLMGNHFHLLIETGLIPIGDVMRRILCRYARYYNKTNRRLGHLFQSRFLAKPCLDEAYFLAALRYIHRNPVEAGLVETPGEWLWSSHRQFVGGVRSTLLALDRTFSLLGDDPASARRRYLTLMEEESDFQPSFEPASPPDERKPEAIKTLEELVLEVPESEPTPDEKRQGSRPRAVSRFRRSFTEIATANGYGVSAIASFWLMTGYCG
ncbi:MAG: transposase [Elusimicrobia bacterium]|nr:transposase [Elusimicrobiota bacterium]